MPRTRSTFADEFKREAVKPVKQPGAKVTHIARDLGIEQMRAASVGQPGAWRCGRHATQQAIAQRVSI